MKNSYRWKSLIKSPKIIGGLIGLVVGVFPLINFVLEFFPRTIEEKVRILNDEMLYLPRQIVNHVFHFTLNDLPNSIIIMVLINIVRFSAIGLFLGWIVEILWKKKN